jgi:GT2 family glycosyltransferase
MPAPPVAATIVTYNSGRFIERCLEFLLDQDYSRFEVIVVDNASVDHTPDILRRYDKRVQVIRNRENLGFAAAQNQAIALTDADWVLTLNPDVRVTSDFLAKLVAAGVADPAVGTVCGKLLAMSPDFELYSQPLLDSTGLYFTPNLRHLDRGSRLPDAGQYENFEYVFGATGAAALYRRQMIEDISIFNEFFDPDFFSYREDADVAWRAQLLGWKCLYTPLAVAYHVRHVLPTQRRSVPPAINMHSVKNRWLMRIKNITPDVYRRNFISITLRDCVVVASCLLGEFTSLRAFPIVARLWPRMLRKRREIMARRRAGDEYLASWFSSTPVSYPAADPHPCALPY